jgi:hypothetical protein
LALRGVGPECKAESVRFHGRRVTKVGPEVKHGLREDWGPLNKGCERRTWALPDVSGGGERRDRFGVAVGVVEPRIGGRFARRVGAGMARAAPLARARDGAGCARYDPISPSEESALPRVRVFISYSHHSREHCDRVPRLPAISP